MVMSDHSAVYFYDLMSPDRFLPVPTKSNVQWENYIYDHAIEKYNSLHGVDQSNELTTMYNVRSASYDWKKKRARQKNSEGGIDE